MAGKLWLVATPIGNLGDISARALEVLRAADLIAAEDTRNTVRLLNHFEIKKPLTSYHEYNKTEKAYELVREAQAGKNIHRGDHRPGGLRLRQRPGDLGTSHKALCL